MMGWLKRYRQSRGFGVHSPFAYRFITEVLRERLPYYDYVHLPAPWQRLLYRIACRFQPQTLCALGADPMPIKMACPKVVETDAIVSDMLLVGSSVDAPAEVSDMLLVGSSVDAPVLVRALGHKCVVIALSAESALRAALLAAHDALGNGMSFDNDRDTLIIVTDPKLPLQHFKFTY